MFRPSTRIGALIRSRKRRDGVGVRAEQHLGHLPGRVRHRDRVVGDDAAPFADQDVAQGDRRRAAQVIGIRLERQPEQPDRAAVQLPEQVAQVVDDRDALAAVYLHHRTQDLRVRAVAGRDVLERLDVLREAAAAVADPGVEEARPDPSVVAHALGDQLHVGADPVADLGDLVDEGDLGGQERVRGVLDHLGGAPVAGHDRAAEPLVQPGDGLGRGQLGRADDDAVRREEVLERRALAQELGVGDDPDRPRAAVPVEPLLDAVAGTGWHGALDRDDRALAQQRRQRLGGAPQEAQVGLTGRPLGRRHGQEHHIRRRHGRFVVGRELEPLGRAVPGDQLGQTGLVDRHLAALEPRDPVGEDVEPDDQVAQLGQAGGGDEPDVAEPHDGDASHRLSPPDS
jgi:hypothetical protein